MPPFITDNVDPVLGETHTTFDGYGNQLSVTSANNATSTLTYSDNGKLLSARNPCGNTTKYAHDAAGRQ